MKVGRKSKGLVRVGEGVQSERQSDQQARTERALAAGKGQGGGLSRTAWPSQTEPNHGGHGVSQLRKWAQQEEQEVGEGKD